MAGLFESSKEILQILFCAAARVYDAESGGACGRKLNWTVRTAGVRVHR